MGEEEMTNLTTMTKTIEAIIKYYNGEIDIRELNRELKDAQKAANATDTIYTANANATIYTANANAFADTDTADQWETIEKIVKEFIMMEK